ncbi:MAG: beta-ketoacyl synthase N-terminal-like domain-containing protein [Pirellulales bacterium]
MSKPSAQWLHSPLAIVGMACRLPGADGLEQFWDLLKRGGYAVERMPDSKLDRRLYFDPEKGKRCKTYSQVGGFVRERELDWSLLNICPENANQWDQCHLALCEVVARACLNAGYDPKNLPNRNVGVFVGHSGGTTLGGDLAYRNLIEEYLELLAGLPEWKNIGSSEALNELRERLTQTRPQRQVGGKPFVDAGFASGLISHNFGLTGPHMSIDAACASSLIALALGSMSLASGQAEMAIIGGASYNKADSLVLFSAAQSCSSQMSRPFDQGADGLISAEGYVSILVKPLEKAHRDGDRIHAVIRGIGYSSDGRGRSLWAPRHEGQSTAIERAYASDINPNSVQLIEAHATSTQVGDATEMEALASFYATRLSPGQRLPVGSVKSNIGHTLETAGLAGLVKSVLAIQHAVIPPSINLQNPNQSIPWDSIPFYVPKTAQPWPVLPDGHPRRAAVNAFGIGGLNVHVVVDEALPLTGQTQTSPATQSSQTTHFANVRYQPVTVTDDSTLIAVVGRGLVVPGANSLAEYQAALASPIKTSDHGEVELTHRVQFEYDWRKHKVPPKQVANANPLQFMLLEAAEQALVEAGLHQSDTFDRAKSAVVVGSIFGGDFGNQLFAGLRLPEFRDRLHSVIVSRGLDTARASQICEQFEQKFLEHYPALLDETGSFTSSTLASRIAKTFNLMGGAMAIDAGDCSGLAALRSACWLLQSGSVSTVLCAAAQLALDRAALENLRLCGRLKQTTTNNADSQGYTIGEGVVLLVLKRLSDAQLAGDKVLAVIDQVNFGYDNNSLTRSVEIAASACQIQAGNDGQAAIAGSLGIAHLDHQVSQALQSSSTAPILLKQPANLNRTGHLQGAQGLLDVVNCTLDLAHRKQWIVSHTLSGQSAFAQLTIPHAIEIQPPRTPQVPVKVTEPQPETLHADRTQIVSPTKLPAVTSYSASNAPTVIAELETVFWSAGTLDQLRLAPKEPSWTPTATLPASGRFIATVVAPRGQAAEKARKFSSLIGQGKSLDQLIDQGLWWLDRQQAEHNPPRIGFAFAGQGSQYGGMLSAVAKQFPQAQQVIQQADRVLQKLDGSSFGQIAWSAENQLGENVWQTQIALLVADTVLGNVVRSLGIEPELVFGHSYGEIPAMLAASSIDLESAIHLTWHRCQCVTQNAPSGCSMLSVQADAETVSSSISSSHLPLAISHINAPLQTVVGGKHSHVAQLAALLDDAGITSRILPVPTAFHTPALQAAVGPFRLALNQIEIWPPKMPLLSSVNNRFMADPDWMREGLAEQLVTPLRFVELLQKVVASGITHLIEIGPQRVLTRLSRASETGMQVFASDYGPQGENSPLALMPLGLVAAFAQMTGGVRGDGYPNGRVPNKLRAIGVQSNPGSRADSSGESNTVEIKSFDATAARRARMRSASSTSRDQHPNLPVNVATTPGSNSVVTAPALAPNFSTASAQSTAATTATLPASPTSTVSSELPTIAIGPAAEQVQQILIDFVVEQTGYPSEIVELDADLEADLGIDSIKKAQLMGELRELFPQALPTMQSKESRGDARAQGNRLAQLRTLRDFVGLICISTGSASTLSNSIPSTIAPVSRFNTTPNVASGQLQTVSTQVPSTQTLSSSTGVSAASGLTRRNLEQFVIDFVVEQTGYPAEIVELNADLEADLGIDSIKKAQLLGELRETFAFQLNGASEASAGQTSRSKGTTDQLRTLNQILDVLSAQLGVSATEVSLTNTLEKSQSYESASTSAHEPTTEIRSRSDTELATASQKIALRVA